MIYAAVVESADTKDLKSFGGNIVRVQVSSAAPGLRSAIRDELPTAFNLCGSTMSGIFLYHPYPSEKSPLFSDLFFASDRKISFQKTTDFPPIRLSLTPTNEPIQ